MKVRTGKFRFSWIQVHTKGETLEFDASSGNVASDTYTQYIQK